MLLLIIFIIVQFLPGFSQDSKGLIYFDNFESYIANSQLACQNPENWTTWNNLPCTYEDPYIIDTLAFSGSNSVVLVDSNDLVKPIDNYTEGRYRISFKMYIPEGFYGYFNTLQLFDGLNSKYGMQVFFEENGNGQFVGQLSTYFNYSYNTWFNNDIIIDLDNDWAKYFFNNLLIDEWTWSMGGSFSGINQLGGSNFYSWDDNGTGISKYYIDDYQIEELEPYQLMPPENLTLETSGNDIILIWDSPFTTTWIQWDLGINGSGIGAMSGGTFYTASRWFPEDLVLFDNYYITKIKFFPYEDPNANFVIKVWAGENAGNLIYSQNVTSYVVDTWNEAVLNSPVLIDATQELWFGYEVTHGPSTHPAGVDEGPALIGRGDMFSFDGVEWMISFFDNNWNLAAYVSEMDDNIDDTQLIDKKLNNPRVNSKNMERTEKKFAEYLNPSKDKSFIGYNIYHSFNWEPFELLDYTIENTWIHEDLTTGFYAYYVTALYDEGESGPSDTVSAFLTNINENKINNIRISPNPAKDFVQIESGTEIYKITLYDMTVRIKKEITEINRTNFNLSVSEYNSGVYLIRIEIDNDIFIKRIIIQ